MALFGRDTPLERPDTGGRAALFVPAIETSEAVSGVFKNGSGMAGFGNPDGSLTVYFENNRFGDSTLLTWEGKVNKAYDRMVKRFPTVNKLICDASDVVQVGYIQQGHIVVRDRAALTAWLERSGAADSAPDESAMAA